MNAILNCVARCQRTLLSLNRKRTIACNFSIHANVSAGTDKTNESDDIVEENVDVKRGQNTTAQRYRQIFATPDTQKIIIDGMKFSEIPVIRINSAKNNTFISLTTLGSGNRFSTIAQVSCGSLGLNGKKKRTQYAAQALSLRIAELAKEKHINSVRVVIKGFGSGRQPSLEGLKIGGLRILSITDDTQVKSGRPGVRRRV